MKVRKAVIPAAGLGTRFLPATKAQPKEMLPVVDKPAIQYVVEEAVRAGLNDILIITGRGKRSIEDHFDRSVELESFLEARGKQELIAEIPGRDLVSGLPKTIQISDSEIRQAIEEPVTSIIDAIKSTLDRTPPELAGDIMHRGVVLTGGGALLRGFDKRLRHETGMPVHIADNPLSSVAIGSGRCLEEFEILQRVLVSPSRG